MAKAKKLTKGQARQIKANQSKKLRKSTEKVQWQDDELAAAENGIVISRFGQHADVESSSGEIFRCNLRRSISSLVCGDKVLWRKGKETQHSISGVIEAVHERDSVLSRPDVYDGVKPIAANISQILIVSSVLPAFNADIIDRYLVAAEQTGITPVILLNKVDLLDDSNRDEIEKQLNIYRKIGYQVTYVSNETTEGIAELKLQLSQHTSIFVGQSGVGKSTLTNTLMPELGVMTKVVSENSGLGQHTTTVARLYHFEQGGDLIDSPGIREFGLWHLQKDQIIDGMPELRTLVSQCKFRDCDHLQSHGCAIQKAITEGAIHSSRLSSYRQIVDSLQDQN